MVIRGTPRGTRETAALERGLLSVFLLRAAPRTRETVRSGMPVPILPLLAAWSIFPGQPAPQSAVPPEKRPASPAALVETDRLLDTIRGLPVARCAIGDEVNHTNLRAAEQAIAAQLRTLGYEPRLEPFAWAPPNPAHPGDPAASPDAKTWHNVIIDRPGTTTPGEVLVISAHLDAALNAPGADDDGTGVAALLELARVLRDYPTHRTVRLCFFNLEEVGLVGSSRHVIGMRESKSADTVVGMVSLEMLGYFSDAPGSQRSPIPPIKDVFEPPTVGDSIALVGLARDAAFIRRLAGFMRAGAPELKVTTLDFLPIPVPDMMRSDHAPFVMAKMPGVMLTDTANFRNPHYHKPTDTIDTLDPARFTLVVRGIAHAAWQLALPSEGPAPDKPAPQPAPASPADR